ncbi:MAG TPA: NAD-binding protein, partial [Candidatus Wallbacteria bacterium]|nr:NAD-binding protein [Candidatus Wallbacteria bacterium]
MKQCVVVGVGRFGSALLENLSKMNQQVLVVDSDEKTIQMVNDNHLATYAVVADAMDEQVMRSLLGVKEGQKCDYEVGIVCIG